MAAFASALFREMQTQYCADIIVCVKILCFVHPYAHVIRPIIGHLVDGFDATMADLVLRYLFGDKASEAPDFLVFRLKLLLHRRRMGQTPAFWTDEMMQLK
jgi:hypothetical protein